MTTHLFFLWMNLHFIALLRFCLQGFAVQTCMPMSDYCLYFQMLPLDIGLLNKSQFIETFLLIARNFHWKLGTSLGFVRKAWMSYNFPKVCFIEPLTDARSPYPPHRSLLSPSDSYAYADDMNLRWLICILFFLCFGWI